MFPDVKYLIASTLAAVAVSVSALGTSGPAVAAQVTPTPTPVTTPAPFDRDLIVVGPIVGPLEIKPELLVDDPDLRIIWPPLPRPDLIIRDWRVVPDSQPGDNDNDVKEDQAYRVCYYVANIGPVAAGPFRVSGGGLGIPFNPTQVHAGLAAGATASNCLIYPTTPAPGVYNLGVTADSTHIVAESNEGNNSRVEAITVH
jgi:hypothetical protein